MYKEAIRENLEKADELMSFFESDEYVPVDVAQVHVSASHSCISMALVHAVMDLTEEVHELRKVVKK